jgi:hypothetical protein
MGLGGRPYGLKIGDIRGGFARSDFFTNIEKLKTNIL